MSSLLPDYNSRIPQPTPPIRPVDVQPVQPTPNKTTDTTNTTSTNTTSTTSITNTNKTNVEPTQPPPIKPIPCYPNPQPKLNLNPHQPVPNPDTLPLNVEPYPYNEALGKDNINLASSIGLGALTGGMTVADEAAIVGAAEGLSAGGLRRVDNILILLIPGGLTTFLIQIFFSYTKIILLFNTYINHIITCIMIVLLPLFIIGAIIINH